MHSMYDSSLAYHLSTISFFYGGEGGDSKGGLLYGVLWPAQTPN